MKCQIVNSVFKAMALNFTNGIRCELHLLSDCLIYNHVMQKIVFTTHRKRCVLWLNMCPLISLKLLPHISKFRNNKLHKILEHS